MIGVNRMAAKIRNHEKKVIKEVYKHYTQEQIDDFGWYPDKDNDQTYCLDFVDHTHQRKNLVLDKETGNICLKNAG
jgi:hypothetical protein